MPSEFKEFSTNAILKIGDIALLDTSKESVQVKFYTFIWTRNNPISIKIDSVDTYISPHSILALTPNQFLEIEEPQELGDVRVYQFNPEFYCIQEHDKEVSCTGILFFGNQLAATVLLSDIEQEKFEQLHQVLLEEMITKDTIQAEMLRMLIKRFIIKTTRLIKAQFPDGIAMTQKVDLLRKFNMLVELNYKDKHQVSDYAELMFKSAKTLANSFAAYDKSPLQIIHDRIVLEAKRQLYYTDISSKEIAFDLGFDDPSHFSRLFKKQTGESPSMFKKSIAQSSVAV